MTMNAFFDSFKNHFLISMPHLDDPHFEHTVIYLCEHTKAGAMGIIINRPSNVDFTELADHLGIQIHSPRLTSEPIYTGGPVEAERGFILHTTDKVWSNTLRVTDEVSLSASLEALEDIAQGNGPEAFRITLGCAGWDAGQLETEIANNDWLVCEADLDVLFHTPSDMQFTAATRVLGIDMTRLSPDIGHG
ncbi:MULTISPECIES: YqgE/AlgH family protein [Marinomonas]|uniref:YqgE/AlgH family protein n=1 Tax=Marinomonas TaxID=28253 RepID=UPI00201813BF|nr:MULTISPECIES: YqgE/AlgH family protein [Marinomonas]